jgi:hypothetical protein
MKNLLSIFVALLALGLFALPAMAATVDVTVDVETVLDFTYDLGSSPVNIDGDTLFTSPWTDSAADPGTDDIIVKAMVDWDVDVAFEMQVTGDETYEGWDDDLSLMVTANDGTTDYDTAYYYADQASTEYLTGSAGVTKFELTYGAYNNSEGYDLGPGTYLCTITFTGGAAD